MHGPVRPHSAGAVVAVRAVPGASAATLVGLYGEELRIRVCSPPVDGRANEELCAVLATALGLRRREVSVLSGQSARSKQLLVSLDAQETARRLEPWIGQSGDFQR